MSVAGGLHLAFHRAVLAGCQAMQIFTRNANRWEAKPLGDEEIAAFASSRSASGITCVLAHDSYLINLASPDPEKWQRSIDAFVLELERCSALSIPQLVMHPGAHMGQGEVAGIARLHEAFRLVLDRAPQDVEILIENTAGQGSYLGASFEQLAAILEDLPPDRFGICFDSCHAFAAGYDFRSEEQYAELISHIEASVGLERIRAFHLNDSLKDLGSGLDRHEHIGRGRIGGEGFASLMGDRRFDGVPKILETPKGQDGEMDRVNLELLRQLAARAR